MGSAALAGGSSSPSADSAGPMPVQRIAVTRPREDASRFVSALCERGHDGFALPLIDFRSLDPGPVWRERVTTGPAFDWLVFSSTRAVRFLTELLGSSGEAWKCGMVACVGPGTAEAARAAGHAVALVPTVHDADGLLAALRERDSIRGRRFLIPRAHAGRDVLPAGLRADGALEVLDEPVYETIAAEAFLPDWEREWERGIDVVTLASPSTARALVDILSRLDGRLVGSSRPTFVSIGKVTTRAAVELGLAPVVTAITASFEGLLDACLESCRHLDEEPG